MAEYATPRHDRLFSSVIALWNTPRDHKEDRLRPHEYCMRQRSPAMKRHRNEIFRISSFLPMVFVQMFRLCSSWTCNSYWIVQMWSVSPASIAGATQSSMDSHKVVPRKIQRHAIDKDVENTLRVKNPNPRHRRNHHQWLKEFGRQRVHDQLNGSNRDHESVRFLRRISAKIC